jgi:hypothetical protein
MQTSTKAEVTITRKVARLVFRKKKGRRWRCACDQATIDALIHCLCNMEKWGGSFGPRLAIFEHTCEAKVKGLSREQLTEIRDLMKRGML